MANFEGKQHSDLLSQLRCFSVENVRISTCDQAWAKGLVDSILKEKVFKLCQEQSPLPIRNFEYTGSVYERLRTEGTDVDVMVVLKTGRTEVVAEQVMPGYARLKVQEKSSPFNKYTQNLDEYLLPEKFRSAWFTSLVTTVVEKIKRDPSLAVELKVRSHGPAIQLDITDNGKVLSCDLVPSFQIGNNFYVAKPRPEGASFPPCDGRLLWRQSFSILEKVRLTKMDKGDQGCRHELLRIVKTIISRETTFGKLTTYHLKSAFLWYDKLPRAWHRNQLANRFKEYLGELADALKRGDLANFWVPRMNLFEDIHPVTLMHMDNRLRRILDNSNDSLTKILQTQTPGRAAFTPCDNSTSAPSDDADGCHIF